MKKLLIILLLLGLSGCQNVNVGKKTETLQEKYDKSELKGKYELDGSSLTKKEIKNAELDKYKGEPKDEISVVIGDKTNLLGAEAEFKPNIELKRWNEVSFKLKTDKLLKNVSTNDKVVSFVGDRIKFDTPKISFEMYSFTEGEGGYKFIWYLNEKPTTNKVEFEIESSGLDFFYQPPLTEEFKSGYSEEFQKEIIVSETQVKDLEGNVLVERPENIVGSYAVYHSTKGVMVDRNGKDYKTGQMGMIYRSKAIDANGNWTWEEINIDTKIGILTVITPQEFLDKAVYPVKSSSINFGYETQGGTLSDLGNFILGPLPYSPISSGVADSISVYIGTVSGTPNIKCALYAGTALQSPQTEQIGAASLTQNNWNIFHFVSGPTVTSGTNYTMVKWASGSTIQSAWNNITNEGRYASKTYGTWPDPQTLTIGSNKYSIYTTYTPSGGTAKPLEQITIFE